MDCLAHPRRRWALRQAGALLLVLGYAGGRDLAARVGGHFGPLPLILYGEALLVYIVASMGVALLFWGHHLFDRVTVADRWQRRDADCRPPPDYANEDHGPFRRVLPGTVPHETSNAAPVADNIPRVANPRFDTIPPIVVPLPTAKPHQADAAFSMFVNR